MKQTTFNISFYCRNCRVNRDGTAPVEMSIVIAGQRCLISLPRKEKPAEFMRQLNAKKDNDLKIYLDAIRLVIGRAIRHTSAEWTKYRTS